MNSKLDRDTADDTTVHADRPASMEDVVRSPFVRWLLVGLRLVIGWTFLWPFLDKLFGLGYATPSGHGWLDGGSPTTGFLTKSPEVTGGPFADFFTNFAGGIWDYVFMFGLAGIGLSMLLGAVMKIAAWGGSLLMLLMYLAELPIGRPAVELGQAVTFTNPITDAHWIEALALLVLAYTLSGDKLGLGRWWGRIVGNGILR